MITHLIEENGRAVGAAGFRLDAEETVTILAKPVRFKSGPGSRHKPIECLRFGTASNALRAPPR